MAFPSELIAPFSFLTAGQIRFGRGVAMTAADDIAALGKRVLLVRGRSVDLVDDIAAQLSHRGCVVTTVFGQGEPTCAQVDAGTVMGRDARVDVVVSIGGGAVLDLGKALAAMIPATSPLMDHLEVVGKGMPLIHDPLPHVAMPTTSGTGSEVTKNAVISVPDAGRKVSLRDNRMLPRLAIVDPALTDCSPAAVTFASGFDAVTQVIEPYVCAKSNPLTDALCRAAIPMGLQALANLARQEDQKSRDALAFTSLVGGLVLANAGLGAVHGLAGVIGGRFSAPHGVICARLLEPVLHLNKMAGGARKTPGSRYDEIDAWILAAFDAPQENAHGVLARHLDTLALPRLGNWITQTDDLDAIAAEAAQSSSFKANPVVLSTDDLVWAVSQAL